LHNIGNQEIAVEDAGLIEEDNLQSATLGSEPIMSAGQFLFFDE
jgi:hypothetical protein